MYGQGVAERAKLRARAASAKRTGKDKEVVQSTTQRDVIELSSDDEISLLPNSGAQSVDAEASSTKARAKEPRSKSNVTQHKYNQGRDSSLITPSIATSQPETSHVPELPARSEVSELQSATNHNSRQTNSRPQTGNSSSSPVSTSSRKQRKRMSTAPSRREEERGDDPQQELVAPSPFFADSSSLPPSTVPPHTSSPPPLPQEGVAGADFAPKKAPARKIRKRKVVDSDDEESDWAESSPKQKVKPPKRRRKAGSEDEDDDESDWAADDLPCGKAKAKAKGKQKEQGNTRAKRTGKAVQKVVVEVNPPRRARRNTASVSPRKSKSDVAGLHKESERGQPKSARDLPELELELVDIEPPQSTESNKVSSGGKAGVSAESIAKRQEPLSGDKTTAKKSSLRSEPMSTGSIRKGKRVAISADDEEDGESCPKAQEDVATEAHIEDKGTIVSEPDTRFR